MSKWDVVGRIGGASWTARVLQDVLEIGCEVGNYLDLAPKEQLYILSYCLLFRRAKNGERKSFTQLIVKVFTLDI